MDKNISEKFKEIMNKGPDVLPTDICINCIGLFCNGDMGKNMPFISKGKSNKLGGIDDSASPAR